MSQSKSIYMAQNLQEFEELYSIVSSYSPRRVLEIGIEKGGTLIRWTEMVGIEGKVLGIDINPEHQDPTLTVLTADSHNPETFQTVRNFFGGGTHRLSIH